MGARRGEEEGGEGEERRGGARETEDLGGRKVREGGGWREMAQRVTGPYGRMAVFCNIVCGSFFSFQKDLSRGVDMEITSPPPRTSRSQLS